MSTMCIANLILIYIQLICIVSKNIIHIHIHNTYLTDVFLAQLWYDTSSDKLDMENEMELKNKHGNWMYQITGKK